MVHNKKGILFKMIAVLTSAVLLAGILPAGLLEKATGTKAAAYAANEINGHAFLTENENYRLYLNEEDLSVVVEDKKTGAYMESSISYDDGKNNDTWLGAMKSAVVLTMINGSDDTKQADLVNDKVTKTVTKTENGFKASIYFTTYKFGFDLEGTLSGNGFTARIPEDSIHEDGDKYFIGTITMYPYLGHSYMTDKEGYIFVPDGNGALIYLDDKEGRFKSGFASMIYGTDAGFVDSSVETLLWDRYDTVTDSEKVMAPVFGIAHTDDQMAYLAIVEEGEERASIEGSPNGVSVDYNRAFAKFILRRSYTQPTSNNSTSGSIHTFESERSHSDLQVKYLFLSGEDANYAGMANAYREYLIERGDLVTADCSYRTRVDFLGTERENWVLGTTPVVMTTVADVYDIFEDLQNNGVTDIFSVYKGWQRGGLYSLPISSYDAADKIGGNKALTGLLKDADAKGISMFLYNDALLINPAVKNATFNVVKKINKRRFELTTHKDVYDTFLYLIPDRSAYMLDKFVKSYTKKGIDNVCLAGVTNTLFSYTYSGNKYTRFDTAASYDATMTDLAARTELVMEQPFAYLWKNTEAFLDMPLYTSSYILEDASVPFLSIVLKGIMPVYSEYVNFEANKQEYFLKMIETGTYPSFYITKESSSELIYTNSADVYSSEYSAYSETIEEYNKELKVFNDKLAGAVITGHDILADGLIRVTYSNGVRVYVNYGKEAASADGITIGAMSYEVN